MPGPFFIAGTARCGTTRLRQVLGEHPEVYAVRWESRFIVDPGGFADAVLPLTEGYTPLRAQDTMRRLADMLACRVAGYGDGLMRGTGLLDEVGHDCYAQAVATLWERLTWYEFDTIVPPLSYRFGRWQYSPGEPRSAHAVVARHFTDRAELIAAFREFTDTVFGAAARQAGKRIWCEKSPPGNLMFIPFLLELFPQATVVAVMRHPVHVAASFLDQPWAPRTLADILHFLEPVYRSWLAARPALLGDPRYLEVKSEELAEDWPRRRRKLFADLELPDADTPSTFEPERLGHRDGQLDARQRAEAEDGLGFAIQALGYA